MHLKVSEQFYSLQGEGRTVGIPAVFLRLQGCNLTCGGKQTIRTGELDSGATWRCDTIEIWTKGKSYAYQELCDIWKKNNWIHFLKHGAHLVITGGEPLLQQEAISEFLFYFKSTYNFLPVIEIETNGTILPSHDLISCVEYFNLSPKLSNSGMLLDQRLFPDILSYFNRISNSIFKFVVANKEDVVEVIRDFVDSGIISHKKVFLMPGVQNKKDLNLLEPVIINFCKQYCFKYSNRLHIQIWDQATGV